MVSLGRDSRGNYKARKRLPADVREEYGRLYGPSVEAKFHAPASTKRQEAERQFHEWKAGTDARIAAIRAQHTGEGIPLTRQQARALAGEWYELVPRAARVRRKRLGTAARPSLGRDAGSRRRDAMGREPPG